MPRNAVPNLEWKTTAIADLLAIVDYISDDNPDAAQALKDEIEGKTSRLQIIRRCIVLGALMGHVKWLCFQITS